MDLALTESQEMLRTTARTFMEREAPVDVVVGLQKAESSLEPVPFAERSRFAAKLARGEMVTSVEIVPPRGVDATRMLNDVAALFIDDPPGLRNWWTGDYLDAVLSKFLNFRMAAQKGGGRLPTHG